MSCWVSKNAEFYADFRNVNIFSGKRSYQKLWASKVAGNAFLLNKVDFRQLWTPITFDRSVSQKRYWHFWNQQKILRLLIPNTTYLWQKNFGRLLSTLRTLVRWKMTQRRKTLENVFTKYVLKSAKENTSGIRLSQFQYRPTLMPNATVLSHLLLFYLTK